MKRFLLLTAAIVSSASSAHAGIVLNGSFESGLANWTSVLSSNADTQGTVYGVNPRDGSSQARLQNNTAVTSAQIEFALGLTPGRLATLSGGVASTGSAIYQDITADAGDELTFEWDFLTNETGAFAQDDFSFWSITSNNGEVLGRVSTPGLTPPPAAGFQLHTGYQPQSFTFTAANSGTVRLGFGVINRLDAAGLSGLLVDNVRITAVPEPSSLLLLGLAAPAALLRRRKR